MAHSPLPSAAPHWKPIQESVSRLRSSQQYLEQFVQQLLTELELARAELADNEAEIRGTRQQLAEAQLELQHALQQANSVDPAVEARLAQAEKERTELEIELETIRVRAADMAEALAEQKKQLAEERAQWTGELRQMRKLLEKQSEAANHAADANHHHTASEPKPREHTARSSDPVLGSVMAQFESLQKDIARRKAKSNGTNS